MYFTVCAFPGSSTSPFTPSDLMQKTCKLSFWLHKSQGPLRISKQRSNVATMRSVISINAEVCVNFQIVTKLKKIWQKQYAHIFMVYVFCSGINTMLVNTCFNYNCKVVPISYLSGLP